MKKLILLITSIVISSSSLLAVGNEISEARSYRVRNTDTLADHLFGDDFFLTVGDGAVGGAGYVGEWEPEGNGFLYVQAFKLTTDFASDLNAGDSVRFDWTQESGRVADDAQVFLLNYDDGNPAYKNIAKAATAADGSVLLLDNHTGDGGAYSLPFDPNTIYPSPVTWTDSDYIWLGIQIPYQDDDRVQGLVVTPTLSTLTTIPEPSVFALLSGIGALVAVVIRRRRA